MARQPCPVIHLSFCHIPLLVSPGETPSLFPLLERRPWSSACPGLNGLTPLSTGCQEPWNPGPHPSQVLHLRQFCLHFRRRFHLRFHLHFHRHPRFYRHPHLLCSDSRWNKLNPILRVRSQRSPPDFAVNSAREYVADPHIILLFSLLISLVVWPNFACSRHSGLIFKRQLAGLHQTGSRLG